MFNVVTLWSGQSTVRVPQVSHGGMWNVRYGLLALPFVTVAAGLAVARFKKVAAVIVLGAIVFTAGSMATSTPITLKDGRNGTSSAVSANAPAHYLAAHYQGGRILADDGSASPLIYASGLDLKQFVTIGFHPYYENALRSPATQVQWLVAYPGDAVSTDMAQHPDRFTTYRLAWKQNNAKLYERIG